MPTTLDTIAAGFQMPQPYIKSGGTMAAVAPMRAYTPWYTGGNPGASAANAIGVNGQAVTPGLGASVDGRIRRTNPVAPKNAYLGRMNFGVNVAGNLWLIDRMWQNSGLSPTLTTAQAITPAALPARDINLSANGAGVMAGLEWSATGGAGTPVCTLTYTDQDGNAGASGTLTGVTTPGVGTMEIFQLAAGDTGVRAPTSFIQSATRTSGTFHLVLFRLIAAMEVPVGAGGNAIDALTSGLPRIIDDSTLQILWFPQSTTAVGWNGNYTETQFDPT
jgi:hypothetical protein